MDNRFDVAIQQLKESLFYYWFSGIPDAVMCAVMEEVSKDMDVQHVSGSCPSMYPRLLMLKTVVFMVSFMDAGHAFTLEITSENEDGEEVSQGVGFKAIYENGATAVVRSDSVGTMIARTYSEAKIPEGAEVRQFPMGYLNSSIAAILRTCVGKSRRHIFGGNGSNNGRRVCGGRSAQKNTDVMEANCTQYNCIQYNKTT